MIEDCLKVTTYFGERARIKGGFLADAFTDIYARHELQASLVMRGVEGFGARHTLRTDRVLTLSEDLPLVSVAIDSPRRIEAALSEIDGLRFTGLVTVGRARMLTRQLERIELPAELAVAAKLTVWVGRQERVGARPAYEAVVELLHKERIAGATVLLGVDGTAHGVRQRARFFGRNAEVPLMVIAVGDGEQIAAAMPKIAALLARPLLTLEAVEICKRDGRTIGRPRQLPDTDAAGRPVLQKLTVYAGEQSRHAGAPLCEQLVRALREAGAAGATSLRGLWGYHGDHDPHGERFWALRRHVPVLSEVVDTPQRARRWLEIADQLTDETGLLTSEMITAYRAGGSGPPGPALADGLI